jgi:putative transposase
LGGTFFFTVNLLDRRSHLLVTQIDALRDAVRQARANAPFRIDAWVVLPDHMHRLWTLPGGDADFPSRWRAIKIAFSKSLPTGERRSPVMITRGERGIWQRRYWEHTIRDDRDFAAHMDYTHFNPVKHGLAEHPRIGRIRHFVGAWPADCIRPGGSLAAVNHKRPASGDERQAQRKGGRAPPSPPILLRSYDRADAVAGCQLATAGGGMRCAFPPYLVRDTAMNQAGGS